MGSPNIWNLIPRPNLTHLVTYTCVYICVCVCSCVCVHTHVRGRIYIYTHTHTCMGAHTHTCVYMYVHISNSKCHTLLHFLRDLRSTMKNMKRYQIRLIMLYDFKLYRNAHFQQQQLRNTIPTKKKKKLFTGCGSNSWNTQSGSSLKLVSKFTNLGNSFSSTETDINARLAKAWTAINRLSVIWKSVLTDKMKRSFFFKQWSYRYCCMDAVHGL